MVHLILTGASEGSAVTNPAGLQEPTRKERHKEVLMKRQLTPQLFLKGVISSLQSSWGMISPFQPNLFYDLPAPYHYAPRHRRSPHQGGEGGYLRSVEIRRRPARSYRSAAPSLWGGSCTAPFPGGRCYAGSPPASTGTLQERGQQLLELQDTATPAFNPSHQQPLCLPDLHHHQSSQKHGL